MLQKKPGAHVNGVFNRHFRAQECNICLVGHRAADIFRAWFTWASVMTFISWLPACKLILGGVTIPHIKGLEGHSDADALMHAVCDAVLGALGEPDIGHFFPNTNPRWKDAPSKVFLEEAARQAKFRNARIVNIDATIIAQEPKMKLRI